LPRADEVTERLHKLSEGWRSTVGVAAEALAQQIRADGIDILIDLAGHTASTRIGRLCVQAGAGAGDVPGVSVLDGAGDDRLSDHGCARRPAGESESFNVERLLRLPATAWCYRPPPFTPDVAEAPFVRNGFVTFGSFNNIAKLSGAWCRRGRASCQRCRRAG